MSEFTTLLVAGIVAMLGAALYAAGDVLLLAPDAAAHGEWRPFPVDVSQDRVLRRRVRLLEDLARLPYWRLRWGALLGVFAAPLTVAGVWLLHRAISPAGAWLALPPTLLFLLAAIMGPFVHGSFAYVGETAELMYSIGVEQRPALTAMLRRQVVTLLIAYTPVILAVIVASVWSTVAIVIGPTRLPLWMAGVNPVTMTIAWLLLKPLLPAKVGALFQGAGFNIAYLAWFAALAAAIR